MDTITLKVISPLDVLLETKASTVQLPGVDGQIGILPNHCVYTGLLRAGPVRYQKADSGSVESIDIAGGFCRFGDNTLTILAD